MQRTLFVLAVVFALVAQVYAGNGDLNVSGNITAASVTAPLNGNATSATTATAATSLVTSRGTITTNETGTYGNLQVSGNKNGYFGIRSSDFGRTFMFSTAAAGIYKDAGAWSWYFDDNGVLVIGSVPGVNVTGTVANATNAANLNGQPSSYYQAAATAINTSNIGSQSVTYAANAGSAANAVSLNSQPASFYQNASNLNAGAVPLDRISVFFGYAQSNTTSTQSSTATWTNYVSRTITKQNGNTILLVTAQGFGTTGNSLGGFICIAKNGVQQLESKMGLAQMGVGSYNISANTSTILAGVPAGAVTISLQLLSNGGGFTFNQGSLQIIEMPGNPI
ncbi:hypothetical protein KI809_11275 [Geobacter pelophilus]|uniref:Uncharacterized protein n=1 Tax=Geoanaerobacter pelophilus TaxID=60036 RepID=A0AAW4LAJ6_9BACT|nr:hypothetical protein [Geoanaerobacter pelophilus]MBT0664882.1 hypothetical protein [Geoanaerobacter pelophilus]